MVAVQEVEHQRDWFSFVLFGRKTQDCKWMNTERAKQFSLRPGQSSQAPKEQHLTTNTTLGRQETMFQNDKTLQMQVHDI
jgi:hypothetical protein